MTPRQIARRQAILDTVRVQLKQEGYDALSMRGIAASAGVSPSTLYQIYGSKESLVLHALADTINALSAEEERYAPGVERFLQRLESVAGFFLDHPTTGEGMTQLLFQNSGESPASALLVVNAIDARRTSIEEMVQEGELRRDVDVEFMARTLVSVTWGTVLLWLKGIIPGRGFRDELVRASFDLVLPSATRKSRPRVQEILDNAAGQ